MIELLGFDPVPVVQRGFLRGWLRIAVPPMSEWELAHFKSRLAVRASTERRRGGVRRVRA